MNIKEKIRNRIFRIPKNRVGKIVSVDGVKVRIFSPSDVEKLKEENFKEFRDFLKGRFVRRRKREKNKED